MKIKTRDEWLADLRAKSPDMADEIEGWRCPDCEALAVSVTQHCSATYVHANTESARIALAYDIDPGPPQTSIRPIAYDLTFGCENGHEHYIRTQSVMT